MNFDFSDDQKSLKAEARKFLDAHCPSVQVRTVLDDAATACDAPLWRAVIGQGWLGAAIPEEFGGLTMIWIDTRAPGLPGDIRVDKDVAFKDMPTGR